MVMLATHFGPVKLAIPSKSPRWERFGIGVEVAVRVGVLVAVAVGVLVDMLVGVLVFVVVGVGVSVGFGITPELYGHPSGGVAKNGTNVILVLTESPDPGPIPEGPSEVPHQMFVASINGLGVSFMTLIVELSTTQLWFKVNDPVVISVLIV